MRHNLPITVRPVRPARSQLSALRGVRAPGSADNSTDNQLGAAGDPEPVFTIAGMPSISVVAPASALRADAVVVGLRSTPDGPQLLPGADAVDTALKARLLAGLQALGA